MAAGGIISEFVLLSRGVISFLAMAWILRDFGYVPLIILFVVFIPVLLVRFRNSSRLYEVRKSVTEGRRQSAYFSWLLTGEKPAREVKLFGLGEYFEKLFRRYHRESGEPELRTVKRNIVPEGFASVLKVSAFGGILVYATSRYLGQISPRVSWRCILLHSGRHWCISVTWSPVIQDWRRTGFSCRISSVSLI
jgi:hypothetical protein